MTAKNRQKSSASEKTAAAAPVQDEKKPQKSNGTSGSAGSQRPRTGGSCLGSLVSALFYAAILGGAGLAAFHLQKVVEEIRQTSAKHAESARMGAEMSRKMDNVVQQVGSLRSVVEGLELSLGATRAELEGAVSRMKKGEEETRRVEEALQRLQNDLLRDLSEGISEVKEARERDFSSLETTVEQRLEEVSSSVRASVAEFTEAQGEARRQLAALEGRLVGIEDPALVKQELSAIVDAVAEIRAAKQEADSSAVSIQERIGSVREELQTRNQEVASLSQEVESVRSLMQDALGGLKLSVSAAQMDVQALKDQSSTLEGSLEQALDGVRDVEKKLSEVSAQTQKRWDNAEARLKASEESGDFLSSKVESLLSKHDTRQSTLAEKERGEHEELEALRSSLEDLRSNVASMGETQDTLAATDSLMGQRVEELERRLLAPEGEAEHAATLEEHGRAIASMRRALQEATQTLAILSEGPRQEEHQ
ncbi:cytoskeleton-associated protein 4-like [Dunckerocampus dactyliophorus]|uniref:cytoskeleton-associated protein 4-like n=1 Tax=Dunckerocampus dactyliophorus TaxID=161453 RepID=UPI002404CC27|nr:cytoskeleton-associated protein 4-like [Dunckerocampus dactyliophorus]